MPADAFQLTTTDAIDNANNGAAQKSLNGLWTDLVGSFPSGVSSTSTSKYNGIRDLFSGLAGVAKTDIYATGAKTRPSNLDTRLPQGDQATKHTKLGLAFLETDEASVAIIKKLSDSAQVTSTKFIRDGLAGYDVITIIIVRSNSAVVSKILHRSDSSAAKNLADSLSKHFPYAQVVSVEVQASTNSSTSAAQGGGLFGNIDASTPSSTSTNLPLNLILYGPPGCGKTYTITKTLIPQFEDKDGKRYQFVTFHPSFSYEDFVEGIRPVVGAGAITYKEVAGVFCDIAESARKELAAGGSRRYAIFIDEINRGNVASIFGELISLIEDDKRGSLEVTLPYSRKKFSVPPNLHIIGTMNTADRSIATIDVALRRRFSFQELLPQPDLLEDHLISQGVSDATVDGVPIPDLMISMNERLQVLVDRDHCIGHAFFMSIRSFNDLTKIFEAKILPLLQEFFQDDWRRLCLALGEHPTKVSVLDFIEKRLLTVQEREDLFGATDEFDDSKVIYAFKPRSAWTIEHFRRLSGVSSPEVIENAATA